MNSSSSANHDRARRWLLLANGAMGLLLKIAMLAWLVRRLL